MKIKLLIFPLFLALLFSSKSFSQQKQLWAKSYINEKAPALNIKTWLSEVPVTEDKFVLVDFWATWCGPCKKGIPKLNAISRKFQDDLVVIGVSEESAEKVQSMKTPKIKYYSALDSDKRLNGIFEIKGIPHVVLIDPDGIVRWEGFPTLYNHELTSEVIASIISDYKNK